MFGIRPPRLVVISLVFALLAVAVVVGALYFLKPHANLRVTTGPLGSAADVFMKAFANVTTTAHPRIHFVMVSEPDLASSAKAIENYDVNLAIIRSDVSPPTNGMTVAILRRVAIVFVLPPHSAIDAVTKLYGRTVGIPESIVQKDNERVLDTILSYYNIPAAAVKRVFLKDDEIGPAVQQKRVDAILSVGPVGPGQVVDTVAAVARGTKGTPTILDIDEAEAIAKRFPGFETLDVPVGAFRAKPATPHEQLTVLAATYRFVVPERMPNVVAGAIADSLFSSRAKLLMLSPVATEIEAPDPDSKNPILPIHPGVTAFLSGGERSFLDEFQNYFYIGTMIASVLGSALVMIRGRLSGQAADQSLQEVAQLISIADQATQADTEAIDRLENEFDGLVARLLVQPVSDASGSATLSIAIDHARHAIDRRRQILWHAARQEV